MYPPLLEAFLARAFNRGMAFSGGTLHGYGYRISIHHYGGAAQRWLHSCGVHTGGWTGGKHSHATYPY